MGLDVSFNKEAAADAGLVFDMMRNGSPEAIELAEADPESDQDYLEWLHCMQQVIQIPGTELWADACEAGGNLFIRANKWGRVYEPLTNWLRANNIAWEEF